MMVSRTTKHRRFETGGGGGEGRGGEGRGGASGEGCPKRSEGDGFILHFPHKPLHHLASLWGMGRNSVF